MSFCIHILLQVQAVGGGLSEEEMVDYVQNLHLKGKCHDAACNVTDRWDILICIAS